MGRRRLTNNQTAAVIGTIAGILLILAGFSGASRMDSIMEFVGKATGSEMWVRVLSYVLVGIASLGGVLVIFGGILFSYNRILGGRVLIWLGTGFGVISLVLFIAMQLEKVDLTLAGGAVLKLAGIILAVWAQFKAKAVPRRR